MTSPISIWNAAGPTREMLKIRLLAIILLCCAFPAVVNSAAVEDATDAAVVFSCAGRASGYYADLQSGCQKYHMCDAGGRMYTYSCPNRTLFQQRVMICDHWFMVDCSLSQNYFSSNLLIGQKDKHFVSNGEEFYRRNQEESTIHRRNQQTSTVKPVKTTPYRASSTTPYPWGRKESTAVAQNTPKITKEYSQSKLEESVEKQPVQFGARKLDEKLSSTKFPLLSKKAVAQFVTPTKKEERVLPKEYANNPFFKSVTVGPTQAATTANKGQFDVLTSSSPIRKDHQNLFGLRQVSNIPYTSAPTRSFGITSPSLSNNDVKPFSATTVRSELRHTFPKYQEFTPIVITTQSPSTSGHSFVTSQGQTNQFASDLPELRNAFSNGIANGESISLPPLTTTYEFSKSEADFTTETPIGVVLGDDLGVDPLLNHDEDLSSNLVELRFADTRHMFYIPDTPTRQAEMMSTNNETVLTISLAAPPQRHGAMRFKGARDAKGRNDNCPQCHPAFLLPGKCQPCVLIR